MQKNSAIDRCPVHLEPFKHRERYIISSLFFSIADFTSGYLAKQTIKLII